MKLSKEEYLNTQHRLVIARALLDELPLGDFLADIERADAVGPFLDPTLYREGMGELDKVRRLATAALQFQRCELPKYVDRG